MVSLVAILVWRLPSYIVFPVWLFFAALDGAFLSSVFFKVPQGAWFTLMLAIILAAFLSLWRFGKEAQWREESQNQLSSSALLQLRDHGPESLTFVSGGLPVSIVPGLGIFFDKSGNISELPPCFAQFVTKFAARPAVIVFFHMRPLPLPSIPADERYIVVRSSKIPACYHATIRHGYMDDVLHDGLARELVGQIERAVSRPTPTVEIRSELSTIRKATASQMIFVLGKEFLKIRPPTGRYYSPWDSIRVGLLWIFLLVRENSRTKLADLDMDADKLIEVGFITKI